MWPCTARQVRFQSLLMLGSASTALVTGRAPLRACEFSADGAVEAACVAWLAAVALGFGFLLPAAVSYVGERSSRRRFAARHSQRQKRLAAGAGGRSSAAPLGSQSRAAAA